MNHQRITELSNEASKAQKVVDFFDRNKDEIPQSLTLDSLGPIVNEMGGRGAMSYLAQAFSIYRDEIITYATELARKDVREAEAEIRKAIDE